MKEKTRKKGRLSLALVLIIVLTLAVSTTAYARITITLGRTTMATGMKQRLYTSGGSGSAKSSNRRVIALGSDSKSVIVYSENSGTAKIRCTISNTTKTFNMTVLTNKQIAAKVVNRVQKSYGKVGFSVTRKGGTMTVKVSKPRYGGMSTMTIKVNLSTGRAVCGDGWSDNFSRVPKSFIAF